MKTKTKKSKDKTPRPLSKPRKNRRKDDRLLSAKTKLSLSQRQNGILCCVHELQELTARRKKPVGQQQMFELNLTGFYLKILEEALLIYFGKTGRRVKK